MEGGSTIEDGVQACVAFEQVGVNLRTISGGFCSYMRPGVTEPGYFSDATEALKKQVSVPVILTGGIVDAEAAERLLQEGKADLIGVGRAILKKVLIYTLMHGNMYSIFRRFCGKNSLRHLLFRAAVLLSGRNNKTCFHSPGWIETKRRYRLR